MKVFLNYLTPRERHIVNEAPKLYIVYGDEHHWPHKTENLRDTFVPPFDNFYFEGGELRGVKDNKPASLIKDTSKPYMVQRYGIMCERVSTTHHNLKFTITYDYLLREGVIDKVSVYKCDVHVIGDEFKFVEDTMYLNGSKTEHEGIVLDIQNMSRLCFDMMVGGLDKLFNQELHYRKTKTQKVKSIDESKKKYFSRAEFVVIGSKKVTSTPSESSKKAGIKFLHSFFVRGHWRMVKGIGHDIQGLPTKGRTWVKPYKKGDGDLDTRFRVGR